MTHSQAKNVIKKIRWEIECYFKKHHLTYAIFGKSEGLDSSVIAGLLSNIPDVKPIGVLLPLESNLTTSEIGQEVLEYFKIPYLKTDLTHEFHQIAASFYESTGTHDQLTRILRQYKDNQTLSSLAHKKFRALGNIKARLRMITLYHIAQVTSGIVISTDNYSEYWMGFWTVNGDVGDLAPIQQIFKGRELYTIAEALKVPKSSLDVAPTDGLDVIPGGTDQDQLHLPYKELDSVIIGLLQSNFHTHFKSTIVSQVSKSLGISKNIVAEIANRLQTTEFKRHIPIQFSRSQIGLPPIKSIK